MVEFFKKKSTGDKGIAFFLAKVSPRQKKSVILQSKRRVRNCGVLFFFLKSDSGRARL